MTLARALPTGGGKWKKTELHLEIGEHKGYFIGIGEPVIEQTSFPCRACNGECTVKGDTCRACQGTGKKIEEKAPLRYQMGPQLIEEEWVNYRVSGPGQTKDGGVKKATTLWKRLRALSGLLGNEEIVRWYDELEARGPIKISIAMVIDDVENGQPVISSIRPLKKPDASAAVTTPSTTQGQQTGFGDEFPA